MLQYFSLESNGNVNKALKLPIIYNKEELVMSKNQQFSGEEKKEKSALPEKITKADIIKDENTTQSKVIYVLKTALLLLVSSFLVSFSAYCLIEPNEFTVGGAAGIAIMVSHATNGAIGQSTISSCINIPLVILSFFFVKKKFAVLTASNILLQIVWLLILENCQAPLIVFPESSRIFAALAAAVCFGVAIAIAFKIGGSTGGADIIAVILQRNIQSSSIAWMLFFVNAVIISASFFVFNVGETDLAIRLLPIFMAVFEAYIESKINDSITNGFQSAIEFRIITNKPEEISFAIMHELSRGVTELPAKGMYTQEMHSMLVCVISKRQVGALQRIMKEIDPDSFAVMSNVSQVLGLGFFANEN